jgi:hypothetical protein
MPATEVDLTDNRPIFLCKLNFVRGIVLMSLGKDLISEEAQGVGAMVSVAPALALSAAKGSRRLSFLPLTSNKVGKIHHLSAWGMSSGVAR